MFPSHAFLEGVCAAAGRSYSDSCRGRQEPRAAAGRKPRGVYPDRLWYVRTQAPRFVAKGNRQSRLCRFSSKLQETRRRSLAPMDSNSSPRSFELPSAKSLLTSTFQSVMLFYEAVPPQPLSFQSPAHTHFLPDRNPLIRHHLRTLQEP